MERICIALNDAGYECVLVGRLRSSSKELNQKSYEQIRIPCLFDRGKLFYIEYNFKLFWSLLFRKSDALCAIDLDTLLPAYIVSKLSSKVIIYDSHEYFTELEEVITRPFVYKIWSIIERAIVPKLKHCYTISSGYAGLFKTAYDGNFEVIRNVPLKREIQYSKPPSPFIIYQGALNIGRGLEESILAMREIDSIQLRIYGDGPIREKLEGIIDSNNLSDKVKLHGSISPEQLRLITPQARFGLTLFSKTGMHHLHSMANRFFDYFHADIPQIAMGFPEYESFNREHEVAHLVDDLTADTISEAIKHLLQNEGELTRLKNNCSSARDACNWQEESLKLVKFYNEALK